MTCMKRYLAVAAALMMLFAAAVTAEELSPDAADKLRQDRYEIACALMNVKRYDEAIAIYRELGDYSDAAAKLKECEDAVYGGEYLRAAALMEAGRYEEAAAAFDALGGYDDAAEMAEKCRGKGR